MSSKMRVSRLEKTKNIGYDICNSSNGTIQNILKDIDNGTIEDKPFSLKEIQKKVSSL